MENKANYALIGTFVLLLLVLMVGFVMWFSGVKFDQQFEEYEIGFTGTVRGLSEGSEVRYVGLNVGKVVDISLDPENINSVIVTIQVNSETPVYSDSYARLETSGLTGASYIQIFSENSEASLLREIPHEGLMHRISGRMSSIDSFVSSGTSIIEGTQFAIHRFNTILTDEAIDDVKSILANINKLSGKLADMDIDPELVARSLKAFEDASNNVSQATHKFDVTLMDISNFINTDGRSLMASAQTSLGEVDKTIADISVLSHKGSDLVVDSQDMVNQISTLSLTDLKDTLDNINRLVLTFNEIADGIEQSPVEFISGQEKHSVELPR